MTEQNRIGFKRKLYKIGNSCAVVLKKDMLGLIDAGVGDTIRIFIEKVEDNKDLKTRADKILKEISAEENVDYVKIDFKKTGDTNESEKGDSK